MKDSSQFLRLRLVSFVFEIERNQSTRDYYIEKGPDLFLFVEFL